MRIDDHIVACLIQAAVDVTPTSNRGVSTASTDWSTTFSAELLPRRDWLAADGAIHRFPPEAIPLHIKPEFHHVAIGHHVVLTLDPHLAA